MTLIRTVGLDKDGALDRQSASALETLWDQNARSARRASLGMTVMLSATRSWTALRTTGTVGRMGHAYAFLGTLEQRATCSVTCTWRRRQVDRQAVRRTMRRATGPLNCLRHKECAQKAPRTAFALQGLEERTVMLA